MKSQVSFKVDGYHNNVPILSILKSRLNNPKTSIQAEGNLLRVFVAADNTDEEVFDVCYGIQCSCVYDKTQNL
jgi:hypothetical protein